jgi:hypothetical protein
LRGTSLNSLLDNALISKFLPELLCLIVWSDCAAETFREPIGYLLFDEAAAAALVAEDACVTGGFGVKGSKSEMKLLRLIVTYDVVFLSVVRC